MFVHMKTEIAALVIKLNVQKVRLWIQPDTKR